MQERRQLKRELTSLFVRFTVDEQGSVNHEGFTQDASLGGLRLLASSCPEVEDSLNMSIDVPNNPDMTVVEGSVRWVGTKVMDDDGKPVFPVGVEFTYIDRRDKKFLEDFFSRQAHRV
jgi:PilZ domain.